MSRKPRQFVGCRIEDKPILPSVLFYFTWVLVEVTDCSPFSHQSLITDHKKLHPLPLLFKSLLVVAPFGSFLVASSSPYGYDVCIFIEVECLSYKLNAVDNFSTNLYRDKYFWSSTTILLRFFSGILVYSRP